MAQLLLLIAQYGSLLANNLFLRFGRLTLFLSAPKWEWETLITLKKLHKHRYKKLNIENETQFSLLWYLFTIDIYFIISSFLFYGIFLQ